ncbi:hypothetical protein BWQ96_02243 [Gracilariopsis chorda]|uniref:Glycosyltransferase 61 catalytic domain-containing protein n=1 Tax=Gracilariopsis chorda TaxID=448386 RepID=A0A2V3J1L2_9FLOR|nr:hypothetical protein BWQ96_02243 [Gracilariopsis chorda]|eukprot:PXF47857.1 hypothetical protein BWQ96_02243 [Gracilariopsis chorda]
MPSWMKEHSQQIESCGFSEVSYVLNKDVWHSSITIRRSDGSTSNVALQDDFRHLDVVGAYLPRGKRDLLVHDVTPSILMMGMFSSPIQPAQHTVTCLSRDPESCERYRFTPPQESPFNPLMLIDSQISDTKDYLWPKSLMRLLRNSMLGRLKIVDMKEVYGWRVRSTASCFRSMISTTIQTGDVPPDAFSDNDNFFLRNQLSRNMTGRLSDNSTEPCISKVLVLNRHGRRFMIGIDYLIRAVMALGKKLTEIDSLTRIEAEEVFFENCSFHEQVSIVQESNVVIAAHGDANANFMFLRPQTKVLEIMPYGYASDMYKNISNAYGARYELVRSQADIEVFAACVRHFNADENASVNDYLRGWEDKARQFWNDSIRQRANIASNYEIPKVEELEGQIKLKNLRECASYQRTSVDIKDLARRIVLEVAQQCHVRGDLSVLNEYWV